MSEAAPQADRWVLLVTGSRHYPYGERVWGALEKLRAERPGMSLLVGDCPTGVDRMALEWARERGVPHHVEVADWNAFPPGHPARRGAGPRRNEVMAKRKPDLVLAFPGGAGTADMLRRARRRKLRIMLAD